MGIRSSLLIISAALAACQSQPRGPRGSASAPPAAALAVPVASSDTGIQAVVALARQCAVDRGLEAGFAPRMRRGQDAWQVSFVGEQWLSIDPARATCDGRAVHLAAAPPRSMGPDQVVASAQGCTDGHGVGGSALLPEQAQLVVQENGVVFVELPEATITTIPTGRDVVVRLASGECSLAPMD